MKILIADDDAIGGEILRANLERLHHTVELVETGRQAWAKLRDPSFQIVISDWMMPDMDGLDLCCQIRSRNSASYLYVILLTAKSGRDDRLEGFQAGADDFLSKPLDPDELESRLVVAQRILDMQSNLAATNAQLQELATIDGLTGLKNHRAFQERLVTEHQNSERYGIPLCLALIDIDYFKQFNDTFGHPAGDVVIKQVSGILQQCTRASDFVARYGGEEFVIILPHTESELAVEVAERIRAGIVSHPWRLRPITVSIGVSSRSTSILNASDLVERADQALYSSKETGRNRVTMRLESGSGIASPAAIGVHRA